VKFPGSKLLHNWDLSAHGVSLDDLLRSCQQVGLTGLAEVKLPFAVGMIFYYLGAEVNALYREGTLAHHGADALQRLRARVGQGEGSVAVYELPLDMAHLLRGIVNRQRLKETLAGRAELHELLHRLEKLEHTGTLEVQTRQGSAMVLLVRGRISNTYWETANGLTFEKGEAYHKLEATLDGDAVQVYLADFSRDVWKTRHEVQAVMHSRLERRAGPRPSADVVAEDEQALRERLLDALQAAVPALAQALVFDLLTGAVLLRKGRGASSVKVGVLAERVPAMTLYLRDLVAADDGDQVELIEISSERLSVLVGVVAETQEAVALFVDKSQPTALVSAALTREVRGYAARARVTRLSTVS
jgi:hypothetical protein